MKIINSNSKVNLFITQENSDKLKESLGGLKSNNTVNKDTITISDGAKKLLEEESKFIDNSSRDKEESLFKDMLKAIKESSDPRNNPYDTMIKCIQIATRIVNGDRVPGKDELFLMENEPKMYTSAMLLRQQKEVPKKHESLLEDEEDSDSKLEAQNEIDSVSIENLSRQTQSED